MKNNKGASSDKNETVSLALGQIEAAVSSRYSNKELATVLLSISKETPCISFDDTTYTYGIAGSVAFYFVSFLIPDDGTLKVLAIVILLVWLSISTWVLVSRSIRISKISRKLQSLYEANLMNLVEEDIDPVEKAEELASYYYEFQRGDYLSEVTSLHTGLARGNTADIAYELIQFHWVNERTVVRTYTDANGNKQEREEKVYDHFYRTAILAQIDVATELYVYNYGGTSRGVRWKSTSSMFNGIYKVHGASEIEIAKLLKPAMVLLLEKLAGEFRGLNFEFSMDKTLLISMNESQLLESSIKICIANPAMAAEQLNTQASQPKIVSLLSVVDEISRYSINELRRGRSN